MKGTKQLKNVINVLLLFLVDKVLLGELLTRIHINGTSVFTYPRLKLP